MNEKILLVDDDEANLRLLTQWLVPLDYDVELATNGQEALRKVKVGGIDLIILDIMMPGMDGFQVCAELKADQQSRHIPIIMVTALNDRESRLKGLMAGVADFINKPVDKTEIITRTRNLMRVKEYEDFLKTHNELLEQQVRQRTADLESAYDKLKASQDQLLQQEKMATVGLLMAGIAHEINNPLGFISSNLGSLKKYGERLTEFISEQDEVIRSDAAAPLIVEQLAARRNKLKIDRIIMDFPELLEESVEGTERIKKIVQDLKGFSRTDTDQQAVADINQCLKSALGIVHNELKYKAQVTCEYGELPLTICNAQKLGQVFVNLLINAGQAIETEGEITVNTRLENGWIFVAISDTGCGIPEDIRQRIFDPFFTTKELGKGTGLGLAICRDIINKQGGKLELASEIGMGTTFSVSIPVITKES
ncbi:MAG: response regulator [Proteobacteria bacterium]|nr:response regulator [Pseudomonadota bacterium]MBU1714668.1 response regulator [Pseudomonadota bacterium]